MLGKAGKGFGVIDRVKGLAQKDCAGIGGIKERVC